MILVVSDSYIKGFSLDRMKYASEPFSLEVLILKYAEIAPIPPCVSIKMYRYTTNIWKFSKSLNAFVVHIVKPWCWHIAIQPSRDGGMMILLIFSLVVLKTSRTTEKDDDKTNTMRFAGVHMHIPNVQFQLVVLKDIFKCMSIITRRTR